MTTNNDILIKVEGLKKYFGNNEVLKGINAEITRASNGGYRCVGFGVNNFFALP